MEIAFINKVGRNIFPFIFPTGIFFFFKYPLKYYKP